MDLMSSTSIYFRYLTIPGLDIYYVLYIYIYIYKCAVRDVHVHPSLMASPLIVQWSLLVLAIGPALIFSLFVSLLLFSYAKDAIVISSKL